MSPKTCSLAPSKPRNKQERKQPATCLDEREKNRGLYINITCQIEGVVNIGEDMFLDGYVGRSTLDQAHASTAWFSWLKYYTFEPFWSARWIICARILRISQIVWLFVCKRCTSAIWYSPTPVVLETLLTQLPNNIEKGFFNIDAILRWSFHKIAS